MLRFEDMKDIKKNTMVCAVSHHIKRGASTKGKQPGISELNTKATTLKKINISFIGHFCFGKYSVLFEQDIGKKQEILTARKITPLTLFM